MYSRHDLVWLTPQGWSAAQAAAGPAQRAAIDAWARADWPATVRRDDAGCGVGSVALGLSLPPLSPGGAKPKLALRAAHGCVARSSMPLALSDALDAAPRHWQDRLVALDAAAGAGRLRVYGSLALQAITGQCYLTPVSDVDLLFRPTSVAQLGSIVELLALHCADLPLDGEVVFPSGEAVAWKEWRAGGPRVLAKTIAGVRLVDRAALLATLEPA
jgi:phosphoribosyl-dephospho-CoA transferase